MGGVAAMSVAMLAAVQSLRPGQGASPLLRAPGAWAVRARRPPVRAADAAVGAATPAAAGAAPAEYDWRAQWYAVCFEENLPEGAEPLAFAAFGYGLALWRDGSGTLRAVADRCPHRLAKLSEGRVRNGALECLYHGWAFEGGSGKCVSIPQLEEGAAIPSRACVAPYAVTVREGIVFVWLTPGETDLASLPPPPASEDDLDADKSFSVYSFQIDVPCAPPPPPPPPPRRARAARAHRAAAAASRRQVRGLFPCGEPTRSGAHPRLARPHARRWQARERAAP